MPLSEAGTEPLINVIAVAVAGVLSFKDRHARILDSAVLGFAVISLDAHVLRIDGAEMNSSRVTSSDSPTGIFCRSSLPTWTSIDLHLRPIFAHLRFPLAQFAWPRRNRRAKTR